MWGNSYNPYASLQRDLQSSSWLSPTLTTSISNPYGSSYLSGLTNPFAGQTFGSSYPTFGNYGYPFRRW
ncbi:unnamed protein product [Adineta ricciae]|uniref:Uncharacterized protein n=1 Tax=Adineta ricciae TaxID=249248 RepID=A0A814PJP1_ADIRI|nr:unnamed protein product [Adineta ricciae]CAF1106556.1 unnamed protein product [Adineta ricciae]